MSDKRILTLRLEGPLQSWGTSSYWDRRASDSLPSKSGVIGLVSSAMGLGRDDPRIVDMTEQVRMAVRVDRPGTRFVDYQTVTGNPLRTATGKTRVGSQTIVSQREYLADASFFVVLEAPCDLADDIEAALADPKWPPFLGRKSCVPSRPILEGGGPYETIEEALKLHRPADRTNSDQDRAAEIEGVIENAPWTIRSDIRSAVPNRRFTQRIVSRIGVPHVSDKA